MASVSSSASSRAVHVLNPFLHICTPQSGASARCRRATLRKPVSTSKTEVRVPLVRKAATTPPPRVWGAAAAQLPVADVPRGPALFAQRALAARGGAVALAVERADQRHLPVAASRRQLPRGTTCGASASSCALADATPRPPAASQTTTTASKTPHDEAGRGGACAAGAGDDARAGRRGGRAAARSSGRATGATGGKQSPSPAASRWPSARPVRSVRSCCVLRC